MVGAPGGDTPLRRQRRLERPEARDSPADWKHTTLPDPVSLTAHLEVP